MNFSRYLIVAISASSVLLSACSSSPSTPVYEEVASTPATNESDPAEIYRQTQALFDTPESKELSFYAPTYYQSARDALSDAKAAIQNLSRSEVSPVRACIAARKLLEKAQKTKEKVDRNLKELIKHRQLLLALDVGQWQPELWSEVQEDIKKLVELIEQNDILTAVKKEPLVRKKMYKLEVETQLHLALTPSTELRNKAREHEAERYVPTLIEQADKSFGVAKNFIQNNYRDTTGIKAHSEAAYQAALTAYKTAQDAQAIASLESDQIENHLVSVKNQINKLALVFQSHELEPMTVEESLDSLYNIIQKLKILAKEREEALKSNAHKVEAEVEVLKVFEHLDFEAVKELSNQSGNNSVSEIESVESESENKPSTAPTGGNEEEQNFDIVDTAK